MMTFLVMHGFSLLDVRKLYVDEMFEYYKFVFFHLENRGDAKKGTFEKLDGMDQVDQTVNQLRKQLMKTKVK